MFIGSLKNGCFALKVVPRPLARRDEAGCPYHHGGEKELQPRCHPVSTGCSECCYSRCIAFGQRCANSSAGAPTLRRSESKAFILLQGGECNLYLHQPTTNNHKERLMKKILLIVAATLCLGIFLEAVATAIASPNPQAHQRYMATGKH